MPASRSVVPSLVVSLGLALLALVAVPPPVMAAPGASLLSVGGGTDDCLDPTVHEDEGGGGDAKGDDDEKGLPLKPARQIHFRLREGSWISLDVSPDGRTVVFDLLGDLWTVPIEGGEATHLTSGMAFDGQPRYSPDGKRVLFTSDRSGEEEIWILELGKDEPRQVSKGEGGGYQSPEWTPDGQYVIASRGGLLGPPSKPYLYHVDGGQGIQLVKDPEDTKLVGAAFGPDARYVWFAQRKGRWEYNAQLPQYQLVVYDRDLGQLRTVTSRYGSAFRPTLSPDGRWLVYGTRHDDQTGLRLRDLESGEERWLAYPVQYDEQEARASRDVLPGLSFAPDSKEVVASAHGRLWRFPLDGSAPIEIPFDLSFDLDLGPKLDAEFPVDDAPTFVVRQVRDVAPSPDGRRIAFVALDRLWLMDWPGGTPQRVTRQEDHSEHEPAWSPDGRRLVFATWSESGGHLEVVDARPGSRSRPLSDEAAYYFEPAWSPDGRRIVALRADARVLQEAAGPAWGAGGTADIVQVPARGGAVEIVAPANGRHLPHFVASQPDRIWLTHDDRGLVSVRWDGTDERQHLKVVGGQDRRQQKPVKADTIQASPDGTKALAEVTNELYVIELPRTAVVPEVSVANLKDALVPVRKLTTVGGQFPHWSADSGSVLWSVGNACFRHDLADAKRAEEERAAKEKAEKEAKAAAKKAGDAGTADGDGDAGKPEETAAAEDGDEKGEGEDGKKKKEKPAYEAPEVRVRIEHERALPQGDVVLRGARVITMVGDEVIENADVHVHDDRIAGVGPRGTVPVPEGARVVDVSGKTIVPGFVDTHSHMWPAWGIHRPEAWPYLANLAFGVTTTRDPQTSTTDILSYFDEVEAGNMLGPRLYSTGPGIFWTANVRDQDHARDVVRRYAEYYGTHWIKMYVSGTRKQRQWILQAAKDLGLRPTTEGALDLKLDLTQVIDGYPNHEHAFPNVPLYEDVVQLMVESGTLYTPTLLVNYGGPFGENHFFTTEDPHSDPRLQRFTPHETLDQKTLQRPWFHPLRENFDEHAVFVKHLVEAGGLAGVGSHGQLQGLGYHWELWAMASGGMSAHDTLRCATILGARGLGLDGDLGSLERGKLADLLVMDRNPLEDVRNTRSVSMVMKGGRLWDADTLEEVWPAPGTPAPALWREAEPTPWQVP